MLRTLFYHSAGYDYSVVGCIECGKDLRWIFDPSIRNTCRECGGECRDVDFYVIKGDLIGSNPKD
jgi:hypothetical protein